MRTVSHGHRRNGQNQSAARRVACRAFLHAGRSELNLPRLRPLGMRCVCREPVNICADGSMLTTILWPIVRSMHQISFLSAISTPGPLGFRTALIYDSTEREGVPSMAAASTPAAMPASQPEHAPAQPKARWPWLKYATPDLVVLLAAAVLISITTNWNAWEGGRIEQVTDDAIVRGDLTPLITKVAGIVRDFKVSDFQRVRSGDLLVELQDDDYQAQLAQARAAVEAAKAAIENNRRQRELQDSRIQRALAGIDQAKAQVAAAAAGVSAVHADVVRTRAERTRQEALLATQAATKQRVEGAIADEERFAAQAASREADLEQAKTALRSSEIAVETERRTKAVLESQDRQLLADLHAKEAALTVSQVNLGYTKIHAPADGTVGERQVRPGQLVSPG